MKIRTQTVGLAIVAALASGSSNAACQPNVYKVIEAEPLAAYIVPPEHVGQAPHTLLIAVRNGGKTELVRVGAHSSHKPISSALHPVLLAEINDGDKEKIKFCYQSVLPASSKYRPIIMYDQIGEVTIEGNVWPESALGW